MAIDNLSEVLLMEILCRLPVKPLLQLKSVCKNWYALIQNPHFVYLHHDRAASIAAAENTDCLLVKRFLTGGDGGVILSFVPDETPVEDIDISSIGFDMKHLQVFGPCNGVVCLTRYGSSAPIVVCNPSIKEFRVLPEPSYKKGHMCNLGFGFDPYTNDYKVVRFALRRADLPNRDIDEGVEIYDLSTDIPIRDIDERVEMYDLSTDSWREVKTESPVMSGFTCSLDSYASWNGDFFWYAEHEYGGGPVIKSFSMSKEVFEEIPVPEVCLVDQQRSKKKLFLLDNSLAMVMYPHWQPDPSVFPPELLLEKSFDIWVMNEEDSEVAWTKKYTVGPFLRLDWPLGFRQNGEFLLETGYEGQMISYNLRTQKMKEYRVHDQAQGWPPPANIQALPYIESLVSIRRHN